MIIKIANLSDGEHRFSFDEKVKNVGIEEPFFGNCKVEAKLAKFNNQLVLNADIVLSSKFECDRCGEDFDNEIKTQYQMVYLFGDEPEDNDDINLTYLPADADKIDLDVDVRDFALLSVPMKKLCKEDCKGLCANCGKDLNEGNCNCKAEDIDPRWKPLMELKNKLN